jgi:hypothetical protein
MGRKHAKIISRDAFMQSFVEAEVIMRKNLGARIENLIEQETNPDIITGLKQAQEVVAGKVEANDVG